MIFSIAMLRDFRSLIEANPGLKKDEVRRFEGKGELWFSLDERVESQVLEDGGICHFEYLYTVEVDKVTFYFFRRFENANVPSA